MTTEQILSEITSRNTHLVWRSACYIITLSQDRAAIRPLIDHLDTIRQQTKGLEMGGYFAPNQRFVDLAIKIITYHKTGTGCTCHLYPGHDRFDPAEEQAKGNIAILETVKIQDTWIDHYTAQCRKCGQQFRIEEGDSHYTWWSWKEV
jgi:hypothetical protein